MRKLNASASVDARQLLHIDLYNSLVLEIKRYLRREGLNQTELAERLGVSKGYVSRLLNGNGDPKLSSILDLALAIGKEPVLAFTDRPLSKPWDQPEEGLSGMVLNDPDSSYGQTGSESSPSFADKIDWEQLQSLPILEQATTMHNQIESMRPFSRNMENHVVQQLIRTWNYNSNAIEGNSLTYGETLQLLLHGLTAKGKPLKDHLDIMGHQDAVQLMLAMVKDKAPLRQTDIRQLHKILLKEDYQQKAITASGREIYRTIRVGVYKRE
ncbi:MAG: helix-turn-helix domain-containing protein, partial [Bacteroidota bacterium]